MTPRHAIARGVALAVALTACAAPSERPGQVARSTLVIGVDVSGSFRRDYDDAIDFAAHYLYGHLNGLGDLTVPSAVFVGSVGGDRPGQAKSFQPIHAFQGKSVEEVAAALRELYPAEDSFTDFNMFFDRVATLVKRQNLVLAPLNIVLVTDGIHDVAGRTVRDTSTDRYERISLGPLEYLSRSVTVRLLYPTPTVSVAWERHVQRNRVRMWTVDTQVMRGWREQVRPDQPLDTQENLWKWISDNVDFRIRNRLL